MNVTVRMLDGTVHTSSLVGIANPSSTTDDCRKVIMECMAEDLPFYLETEPDCFVVIPNGQIADVVISPGGVKPSSFGFGVTPPEYNEGMNRTTEEP